MKVLFMGTPAFAAASLTRLLDTGYDIVGVVTRPDARSGRGLRITLSEVKQIAIERGLGVHQPSRVRGEEFRKTVGLLAPDVIVVVAYGRILPADVLRLSSQGSINVHASLLPRYRGAAPVAWAIASGERATGVTTMMMSQELDAGDILMQESTPIGETETTGDLEQRLAVMGADLLERTLKGLQAGTLVRKPQQHDKATHAPIIRKSDGRIDWSRPAVEIEQRIRAFNPWPGAETTTAKGKRLRVFRARAIPATHAATSAGAVVDKAPSPIVACGDGALELIEVQPEGRRRMLASEAVSGRHLQVGDLLGTP